MAHGPALRAKEKNPITGADAGAPEEKSHHWRTLAALLPHLWPKDDWDIRVRVILALTVLVIAKGVTVYAPFFYKDAVDALTATDPRLGVVAVPVFMVVAYGVARILMIALAQLRDAFFAKVGQRAVRTVGLQTFRHLHALSLRFHLERRTGGLSRVIERGTKGIDFLLRFSLFSIIPTLIELALVCAILAYTFDYRYALITGGVVLFYIWFTFTITEWRTRFRREMNEQDTKANTRAVDSLLNFETVKYFGNEEHEAKRFDDSLAGYEKAAVKTTTSLAFLNTGQVVIFNLGLIAMMLMAAQGIIEDGLTVGDFVLVNTFLIQLYMPLNLLGTVYREIKQSLIDMENLFDLVQVPSEVEDAPNATTLKVDGGSIQFQDVKFSYEPDRQILKGISFDVPANKTLAIVGPSGAGKSTISRILFRFYDVQSGKVMIDNQPLNSVTQASLRSSIGIVPQDTVLFNDTILYNIRYGRSDATDAEVREVAERAQIADLIRRLPKGYETMVGERGLKLSGGEKQRVAIARTLLKNPPILILDEATSALDSHTEEEIRAALNIMSENRTTVIIAHRLSTVVDADEIIVLDQGEIVERGTHQSLLEKEGVYAGMWMRQLFSPDDENVEVELSLEERQKALEIEQSQAPKSRMPPGHP